MYVAFAGRWFISINGGDRVLDKPIIIVEKFDPLNLINEYSLYDNFNLLSSQASQFPASFIASMRAAGYDFVPGNFTNAKVLEAVITKVNTTKVGTNKSTVIGWSMGGLIACWYLKGIVRKNVK